MPWRCCATTARVRSRSLVPPPVGLSPSALTTVQLNDDNGNGTIDSNDWPDLAVTNFDANNVSVLLGRADGTFAPAVNYTTGLGPFSIAAGDLDRDGDQDLVVANVLANTVSVLRNLGTGTFAAPVTYAAGAGPSAVSVGDLDGDCGPGRAGHQRHVARICPCCAIGERYVRTGRGFWRGRFPRLAAVLRGGRRPERG